MTTPDQATSSPDGNGQHPGDAALDAALRDLHSQLLNEAPPPLQLATAQRLDALRQRHRLTWQSAALAASVLLAFGGGWWSHGWWGPTPGAGLARASDTREFVRQASHAHAVYQPEKRHPVEVGADQQAHLVQWLSKRLDKPLKVPHLEAQGFGLVGGRLLPGEAGPRAQFMYENAQAQRITLYLGALAPERGKALPADAQGSQFRFEQQGPVASFYWVEDGFGYALSGQVDKATLLALATQVYPQVR